MPTQARAATGIAGLDDILRGGLPRDRIYLVQGDPGVGKTTLGLQFLREGVARGERCMYIALSETREEIEVVARSHGWTLDQIEVIELSALEQSATLDADNTLFLPSDVELQETTRTLLAHVERVQADRVVFDSLSELRLLTQSPLRYRRQILGLKQYFADKRSTVILLDDMTSEPSDQQLQSLAHGVITMEQHAPAYGADRRRLRVNKLRGVRYSGGYHELTIATGGMRVFPRLVAAEHQAAFVREQISSGSRELDQLLGGGLDYGTATLILGPSGTGKSSVAVQYAIAAAERGDHAALFQFDERLATVYARTAALGTDLGPLVEAKRLSLQQIDPAELGAGEFAHLVREAVERDRARVVVIDSLNGFQHAMSDEHQVAVQLHELLSYLGNRGVATILVAVQHGLTDVAPAAIDVSYIADTVILLRYFEAVGRIRKAISVVKKRTGAHENVIRELVLDGAGLRVGAPLEQFTGVLTGVPRFEGALAELSQK